MLVHTDMGARTGKTKDIAVMSLELVDVPVIQV